MRKWLGVAVAAAMGLTLTLSGPAEAASYTIYGSSAAGGFDTYTVFKVRGCTAADAKPVTEGGLTGIDSVIVDVSGRPTIDAHWGAAAKVNELAALLQAKFISPACGDVATPYSIQSLNPGPWSFQVPAGSRWMVITARSMVNVSITL